MRHGKVESVERLLTCLAKDVQDEREVDEANVDVSMRCLGRRRLEVDEAIDLMGINYDDRYIVYVQEDDERVCH